MEHLVETAPAQAEPGKKKKGSRVRVKLPGDNSEILTAIRETAKALKGRHVFFRRGEAVVFPSPTEPKMLPMTDVIFRSMIENYVCFFKQKFDLETGEYYPIDRSLNTTDSKTILDSPEFWSTLPEIKRVHPCPLPCLRPDGTVTMLAKGYDPDSGIYTF